MKKIIFIFLSCVLILDTKISLAQTTEVTNAYLSLGRGELADAKTSIDKATADATSNILPKTWVYAGVIYMAIVNDSGKTIKVDNALETARDAFMKVPAMDLKGKFEEDVTDGLVQCHRDFFNMAVEPYTKGNYAKAYPLFQAATDVSHFLHTAYSLDIDTGSLYYAAFSAYASLQFETALKLYKEEIAIGFAKEDQVYHDLSNIYLNLKDTVNALATTREGMIKYGSSEKLMIDEINILIETNRTKEAVDKLTKAITENPDSLKYYYVLGQKYDDLGQKEDAEKIYSSLIVRLQDRITKSGGKSNDYGTLGSALGRLGKDEDAASAFNTAISNEKDPIKKASWNFKAGAMYFNKAAELNSKLDNASPDDAQKFIKERDVLFNRALPFLEAARILNPSDYDTLDALRQLYGAMNMSDKYLEVKKALEELQGQ